MHMKKGNELYRAEKYDEAIGEYKAILDHNPDDWDANYLTAVSYLALYHPGSTHPKDKAASEGAIAALEKLIKLQAPDEETRLKVRNYYLGLLTSSDNKDKAIAYLETVLKEDSKNADAMAQIARLYAEKGDIENSLRWYERRAQLDPSNKETWYTIGVICWERSYRGGVMVSNEERKLLVEKGLAALQKALAIDPDYFDALSYANLLYREQYKVLAATGNQQEAGLSLLKAEEYFKRAMEARKKGQAGSTPTTGA
jgi:tetratricopeptide (TPR) repeat protein